MCGLSAIIDFEPGQRLLPSLLAMHERIPHRGPDGEGFTVVDASWRATGERTAAGLQSSARPDLRLGMAFRWLQIQDPGEAAAQPMASPDGSVWLMFNGEVYNFQEIGRELAQLGHRFTSVSDTEVILAAYMQWGSGCFSRLNGMWAMILLDLRDRKIVISRDRFGIKPLFYYHGPTRLIIGSEVKQLLAAGAPALANRAAVARFIGNQRPATPEETFFKDIFAQPAATFAEISLQAAGNISFQPYWQLDPPEIEAAAPLSLGAACDKLDTLLTQSVAEHMVAQAPLGHLISGGLDSSLLAALAAPNYQQRGECGMGASMVLASRSDRYDESAYIDQVVTALQFQSFRAEFSSVWLKANIDRITWTQEEPVAGMAVAGQFLVYETAGRHGARVVLDGQGADEIFAGYPRHQHTVLKDYLRRRALPALLRELISLRREDARFFRDVWSLRIIPRLARALGLGESSKEARNFLSSESKHVLSQRENLTRQEYQSTALRKELLADILTGNLRPVLSVTDRNAMAHSIEARVPYVDRRIVEFAFQLPDEFKVGDGKRKRIMRLLAERYLPRTIVSRVDRIGFGAPIEQWLTADFRAELAALPDGDVFRRSALFDPSLLRHYIKEFLEARHRDSGTLWRLYAVDTWARVYAVEGI
jgi:asparagine synthase (glutamine-hydrolysing)